MKEIIVKRVAPAQLPSHSAFSLAYLYHTPPEDFVVSYDDSLDTLYTNFGVPKEDVQRFVKYASFDRPYVNMEESEGGLLGLRRYIDKKYGAFVGNCLYDAYKARRKKMRMSCAREKAERLKPLIQRLDRDEDDSSLFDEYLVYQLLGMGRDLNRKTVDKMVGYEHRYVFWLGYLMGKGEDSGRDTENADDPSMC